MATITTTKETSSSTTSTATKPKRVSPLKGKVKRINDGEPESWSDYYLMMFQNIRDKARKYIPDLTDKQIIEAFGLNSDDEER
jgi:hypothetical protein